jgi:hypothetical protein
MLHRIRRTENIDLNPRYLESFLVGPLQLSEFSYLNVSYRLYSGFKDKGFDILEVYRNLRKKHDPITSFTKLAHQMKQVKGISREIRALVRSNRNVEAVLADSGISEAAFVNVSMKVRQVLAGKHFDLAAEYRKLRRKLDRFDAFREIMSRVDNIAGRNKKAKALLTPRNIEACLVHCGFNDAHFVHVSYELFNGLAKAKFDLKSEYEQLRTHYSRLVTLLRLIKTLRNHPALSEQTKRLVTARNVEGLLKDLGVKELSYINVSDKIFGKYLKKKFNIKTRYEKLRSQYSILDSFVKLFDEMKQLPGISDDIKTLATERSVEAVLTDLGYGEAAFVARSLRIWQAFEKDGFDIEQEYQTLLKGQSRKELSKALTTIMKQRKGVPQSVRRKLRPSIVELLLFHLGDNFPEVQSSTQRSEMRIVDDYAGIGAGRREAREPHVRPDGRFSFMRTEMRNDGAKMQGDYAERLLKMNPSPETGYQDPDLSTLSFEERTRAPDRIEKFTRPVRIKGLEELLFSYSAEAPEKDLDVLFLGAGLYEMPERVLSQPQLTETIAALVSARKGKLRLTVVDRSPEVLDVATRTDRAKHVTTDDFKYSPRMLKALSAILGPSLRDGNTIISDVSLPESVAVRGFRANFQDIVYGSSEVYLIVASASLIYPFKALGKNKEAYLKMIARMIQALQPGGRFLTEMHAFFPLIPELEWMWDTEDFGEVPDVALLETNVRALEERLLKDFGLVVEIKFHRQVVVVTKLSVSHPPQGNFQSRILSGLGEVEDGLMIFSGKENDKHAGVPPNLEQSTSGSQRREVRALIPSEMSVNDITVRALASDEIRTRLELSKPSDAEINTTATVLLEIHGEAAINRLWEQLKQEAERIILASEGTAFETQVRNLDVLNRWLGAAFARLSADAQNGRALVVMDLPTGSAGEVEADLPNILKIFSGLIKNFIWSSADTGKVDVPQSVRAMLADYGITTVETDPKLAKAATRMGIEKQAKLGVLTLSDSDGLDGLLHKLAASNMVTIKHHGKKKWEDLNPFEKQALLSLKTLFAIELGLNGKLTVAELLKQYNLSEGFTADQDGRSISIDTDHLAALLADEARFARVFGAAA